MVLSETVALGVILFYSRNKPDTGLPQKSFSFEILCDSIISINSGSAQENTLKSKLTRKSSCVNARGIPLAHYPYTGGGEGVPPGPGPG